MVFSDEKIKEYMKRLLLSRMRILSNNGFYGLLLMHMIYSIDKNCETASTNGRRIVFGPQFLDEISDSELDFVMMHEILHVVLQHCLRQGKRDDFLYNIACDIVVNSNILFSKKMDLSFITLKKYGESIHLAPNGKEGYEYTAEEIYDMLLKMIPIRKQPSIYREKDPSKGKQKKSKISRSRKEGFWDDHTLWGTDEEREELHDIWLKKFEDACEAISIRDPSNTQGLLPLCAERIFNKLKRPQTDWRTILNNFIQQEIVDYSFMPPDRRFNESPFFLPDFNDKDDLVENILFMIDTSGSMSDEMITAAYSEIKGAINQFGAKLKGWLGFFDAAIIKPVPFSDEDEFKAIKSAGGGGTSFFIIFEYVRRYMQDNSPSCIVILTDGYAPFPKEDLSDGIPVLWLLNNDKVEPPWGKVARITV